jgi:hypothetical protein
MKFVIHYDSPEYQDSFSIEVDSVESGKKSIMSEIDKRGWDKKYCWSEEIS